MIYTLPDQTPTEPDYFICPSCYGETLVGDQVLQDGHVICQACASEPRQIELHLNIAKRMEATWAERVNTLAAALDAVQREQDEQRGIGLALKHGHGR